MRLTSIRLGHVAAILIIVSALGASRVAPTWANNGTPAANVATPIATLADA